MPKPQRTLARTTPSGEPAARKPFAGREALVGGLIEAQKADGEHPQLVYFSRDKETQEIMASRHIFEAILMLVNSRKGIEAYREALISHAARIRDERKKAGEAADAKAIPPAPPALSGPTKAREVVEAALNAEGLSATVIDEKKRETGTILTVSCGGETTRLPLSDAIMKGSDPVAFVRKMLSAIDLGRSKEEKRAQSLAQRRSTLPPPSPLGIAPGELDGRMLTFDGKSEMGGGNWTFTYTAEGTGTSFFIPSSLTGAQLLHELDEKLDSVQKRYGKPYPSAILEWHAGRSKGRDYLAGLAEDILPIARTLDYLVRECVGMEAIVPSEYAEAYKAMKKAGLPSQAFMSHDEMEQLRQALDALDHPIYSILRQAYGGAKLGPAAQTEVTALLQLQQDVGIDVCDTAVRNIAEAYHLISGDNWAVFSSQDELRRSYFRMSFTVRREIERSIAEGAIETDS